MGGNAPEVAMARKPGDRQLVALSHTTLVLVVGQEKDFFGLWLCHVLDSGPEGRFSPLGLI